MDQKALEYTKLHYDRHAGKHVDTREALQARAKGPSAPLKQFHNEIKRKLIDRFANGADRLLDFACGRGGDIWKWIDSKISYVKGLDLSPGEIEEAKQRFQEASEKRIKLKGEMLTTCEFAATSALGLEEWREPQPFDVVTCMFAIHYFFVSEAALKQFLHNISINLKEGGYFVGTVPDGKRINACIRNGRVYNTKMLRVEAHWQGQPQTFGSAYICAIGDTVTGSEQGTQGSFEYLVYSNVLEALAKRYGLEPVLDYKDPDLETLFDDADRGKLLKHFKPHFPQSDQSLEWASALFAAFVFRKTGSYDGTSGGEKKEEKGGGVKRTREEAGDDGDGEKEVEPDKKRQTE